VNKSAARPLADRMRPPPCPTSSGRRSCWGGEASSPRPLRAPLPSLIFWGRPGSAKRPRPDPRGGNERRSSSRIPPSCRGSRRSRGAGRVEADAAPAAAPEAVRPHPPSSTRSTVEQGAAGRAAAVRRGRHRHPVRNHHGKSVLRDPERASFPAAACWSSSPCSLRTSKRSSRRALTDAGPGGLGNRKRSSPRRRCGTSSRGGGRPTPAWR